MKAANSQPKIIARKKQGDARTVVDQAQVLKLSERDSLRVLELLKNPPAPSGRLMAAARKVARNSLPICGSPSLLNLSRQSLAWRAS